jgi:HPt (histidine-containing phosphotransfer) domain-containing protein
VGTPETARQFNPEYLLDMSGGDTEFIQEILGTFLESVHDLLDGIRTAARDSNVEKAIFAAHTLKGSSRSVGAEPLGHLCEELETAARVGDMATYAQVANQVPILFAQLEREVQEILRSRAA